MYHVPRAVARSTSSCVHGVLDRFAALRGLREAAEGSGGVAARVLASGARAFSSLVNPRNSQASSVAGAHDRPQFGMQMPKNLRSSLHQATYSVSFTEEIPRLAHVSSRVEHSAALVEDGKFYYGGMEEFVEVGHKLADAARAITLKYFRSHFQIIDKEDMSPVTIADRATEEAMCAIIGQHFPHHAIYGEEGGLTMPEGGSDYVWVLDPIDGTKSFITGKPVFGTLISLVHKGTPVLGIIDQPVLGERWLGIQGQVTTLNGREVGTRSATTMLKNAYMYTTSPHLFPGETEEAFIRVRNKVKIPLYGCDCYAYGLLSAGHVDLVVEFGLKPYDYLALVPVVEGAGGVMTNWSGERLRWFPETGELSIGVVAAASKSLHKAVVSALGWRTKTSAK